jgi:hypothetical protein
MNVHLAIHMKGFVSSLVIGKMIAITFCAATLLFVPNFGSKAYAQENNNNNTLILETCAQ